jgi:hypothetical protein
MVLESLEREVVDKGPWAPELAEEERERRESARKRCHVIGAGLPPCEK